MQTFCKSAFALISFVTIFSFPLTSFSQSSPNFVFRVRTDDGSSGPFTSWTTAPSSWSSSIPFSSGNHTGTREFTGSSSTSSATFTAASSQERTTDTGLSSAMLIAKYTVRVYVKGPQTADVSASTSASVSNVSNSIYGRTSYFGTVPFGTTYAEAYIATGSGNESDSESASNSIHYTPSCSPTGAATFAEYPGINYYLVTERSFSAMTDSSGNFTGNLESDGSVTFSGVVDTEVPTAEIEGPIVSGVSKPNPALGDSVTLNNLSEDPDDPPSTPPSGICAAAWVVTAPDGVQSNYATLSGISFTVSKPGGWKISLTVTDNDGQTATTTTEFTVGQMRTPEPNRGESCHADSGVEVGTDPATGNGHARAGTSAPTREYPLEPNIALNTQTNHPTRSTALGNASAPYTTEVVQAQGVRDAGPRWYVIDGDDGSELNYGSTGSAPTPPPGAYATLNQVTGGYELINAGPPGSIERTGNYKYEFNSTGKLTAIIDPAGNEQSLSYDGSGRLETVTDLSTNRTLEFQYNGEDLISAIVQGDGAATTFLDYSDGKLSRIEIQDGSSSVLRSVDVTYNTDGSINTIERDDDPATTITFTYMNGGNGVLLANITHPNGSTNYNFAVTPASGYTYRTSHTNAKSGVTYFDYDADLNLKRVIAPPPIGTSSNPTYTYTYDSNGNILTAGNGATTYTYTYNSLGLVTRVENNAGRYRDYTYSGTNLTEIEDNIGTLRTYTYGDSGLPHHPTIIEDGDGDEWSIDYNANGQTVSIAPPTGSARGTTTFTYEENSASPNYGYLIATENGAGDDTTYDSYDALGNVLQITNNPASGVTNVVEFSYDGISRLTRVEYSDGKTQEYTYTGRDLTGAEDEGGTTTVFTYCPGCTQLVGVSEPLSRTTSWDLDSDFAMVGITDPNSNTTEYKLGNLKELKEIVFPDTKKFEFTYDQYARLKTSKYPSSTAGTHSYNSSGELSGSVFTGSSGDDVSYTYNADGSLNIVTDANGTSTYAYTAERQVSSVSYNYSTRGLSAIQKVEYTYYPDGLVDTITWKSGTTTIASWNYDYDGAGRIDQVTNSFSQSVQYTYDGEGKILTETHGNGTSTEYEYYEPRGWVSQITHINGSTPFAEYELERDATLNTVGNLTKVTELDSSEIEYEYDALYRLTSEARTGTGSYTRTYDYDTAGNVTDYNGSTFATYGTANTVATISGGIINNHASGLPQKVSVPGGACGQFNFNSRGYINQQKDCSNANTISYVWDGHGRLSYRSGRLRIYSGELLIGEITTGGSAQYAYTWGADGLAAYRNIASSQDRYYHFGPQGETRYLTGPGGTTTDTYRFTGYGASTYSNGSTANSFKYGGRYGYYTEGVTGIIFAGARAYHPHLLRWLQRDPILFDGGVNVWEYVRGNPIGYVDPEGKEAIAVGVATAWKALEAIIATGGASTGVAGFTPIVAAVGVVGIGVCINDWDGCKATLEGIKETCSPNAEATKRPTKPEDCLRIRTDGKRSCDRQYPRGRVDGKWTGCMKDVEAKVAECNRSNAVNHAK